MTENEFRTMMRMPLCDCADCLRQGDVRAAQQEDDLRNYEPPNPYAAVTALRSATTTTEQLFEDNWKEQRLHDVEATRTWLDTREPAPRFTAAEDLSPWTPPDPYAEELKLLRAKKEK